MHTQHAATRGENTPQWFRRAYTLEVKPDYSLPLDAPMRPPYPRELQGAFFLDVLQSMVLEMPAPLVPVRLLGSAGGGGLPMLELRNEVIPQWVSQKVKDAVWRYIVLQARQTRHDWIYFAIGMALPGLYNAAKMIAHERRDPFTTVAVVHRLIATEFVQALDRVELDRAYIVNRLIDQAKYHARGVKRRRPAPADEPPKPEDLPPVELAVLDYLDPDTRSDNNRAKARSSYVDALTALAELVDETKGNKPGHILTVTDAQLVAYTYIDGYTLAQAAQWLNLPEPAARMRRDRARKLMARLLSGKTGRRDVVAASDQAAS